MNADSGNDPVRNIPETEKEGATQGQNIEPVEAPRVLDTVNVEHRNGGEDDDRAQTCRGNVNKYWRQKKKSNQDLQRLLNHCITVLCLPVSRKQVLRLALQRLTENSQPFWKMIPSQDRKRRRLRLNLQDRSQPTNFFEF